MEVDMGKKLSALIPVVMSLFAQVLALTQLVIQVVTNSVGSTKAAEGVLVYVGLLLMADQLPAVFEFRW
jgi:hypothetical protein